MSYNLAYCLMQKNITLIVFINQYKQKAVKYIVSASWCHDIFLNHHLRESDRDTFGHNEFCDQISSKFSINTFCSIYTSQDLSYQSYYHMFTTIWII